MGATPRTGLVLAGGGMVGGAWMAGALAAIAEETGWDPGAADYVLGTSAGAMVGALLATAVPPWLLMAYGQGDELAGLPGRGGNGTKRFGTRLRLHWAFPRPILGSPRLAFRSLAEPWKYGPAGIIGWLPHGVVSTEPLENVVRQVVPSGWPAHPNLWIVAIDYEDGARVIFGRKGSPPADLAEAVAASCAIPGFYRPVSIGRRVYVDGGMYSAANLGLMMESDAELIVCLNPMSSRYRGGLFAATGPIASFVRGDNRHIVDREAAALKRAGRRVLLIEPKAEDVRAMGLNYMSSRHMEKVAVTARRTTADSLRGTELGRILRSLPTGAPERLARPAGGPSGWPKGLFPPAVGTSAQAAGQDWR